MKKTLYFFVIIILLIVGSVWVLDYQSGNVIRGDYYCNGHMRMYCGQSSLGYGFLGMLITWIVILVIGVFVYKLVFNESKESEAISILNTKLANGDISIEEYQRIKNEIENSK